MGRALEHNPDRIAAAIAGALGALIAAAGVVLAVFFGPHAPDNRARARAIAEAVVATFAGFLAAYELSPTAAAWLKLHAPHDLAAVGFVIGVVFWRLLPPLIAVAESVLRARADRLK